MPVALSGCPACLTGAEVYVKKQKPCEDQASMRIEGMTEQWSTEVELEM
jgi:hypothetical protein